MGHIGSKSLGFDQALCRIDLCDILGRFCDPLLRERCTVRKCLQILNGLIKALFVLASAVTVEHIEKLLRSLGEKSLVCFFNRTAP